MGNGRILTLFVSRVGLVLKSFFLGSSIVLRSAYFVIGSRLRDMQ